MKYKKRNNGINMSNKQRSKKRRRTGRRRIAIIRSIESNERKRISKYEAMKEKINKQQ